MYQQGPRKHSQIRQKKQTVSRKCYLILTLKLHTMQDTVMKTVSTLEITCSSVNSKALFVPTACRLEKIFKSALRKTPLYWPLPSATAVRLSSENIKLSHSGAHASPWITLFWQQVFPKFLRPLGPCNQTNMETFNIASFLKKDRIKFTYHFVESVMIFQAAENILILGSEMYNTYSYLRQLESNSQADVTMSTYRSSTFRGILINT